MNSSEDAPRDDGTAILLDFAKAQVDRQDARKSSIEQRGLAVITTSGALVTILFGLSAFSTQSKKFHAPVTASVFLVIALVLFFLAAATALLANAPLDYLESKSVKLRRALQPQAERGRSEMERRTAITYLDILDDAKMKNGPKSQWLFRAIVLEVIAVASLSASIGAVVSPWALVAVVLSFVLIGGIIYVRTYRTTAPTGPFIDSLRSALPRSGGSRPTGA